MKNKKIATSSIILAIAIAVVIGIFIYSLQLFAGQPRQADGSKLKSNEQYQQSEKQYNAPRRR